MADIWEQRLFVVEGKKPHLQYGNKDDPILIVLCVKCVTSASLISV